MTSLLSQVIQYVIHKTNCWKLSRVGLCISSQCVYSLVAIVALATCCEADWGRYRTVTRTAVMSLDSIRITLSDED